MRVKTKPLFGEWDPALTVEIEDAFNPQFYTEWYSLNYLTYEKFYVNSLKNKRLSK